MKSNRTRTDAARTAAGAAFDVSDAAARMGLALSCVIDVSRLATEIAEMGRRMDVLADGSAEPLAIQVLAARIEVLAEAVCTALDDMHTSPYDIGTGLYPGVVQDDQETIGYAELAKSLRAAFQPEGATPARGKKGGD